MQIVIGQGFYSRDRNNIDYAKGIGDSTVGLLNQNTVLSQTIYSIGKTRLEKHPWWDKVQYGLERVTS